MNARILLNEAFIETAKQEIKLLNAGRLNAVTWELFKEKIKAVATTIAQREAAQRKAKMRGLMRTLRDLVQTNEEQLGEFQEDIRTIKKDFTTTWNNDTGDLW